MYLSRKSKIQNLRSKTSILLTSGQGKVKIEVQRNQEKDAGRYRKHISRRADDVRAETRLLRSVPVNMVEARSFTLAFLPLP